MMKVKKFLLAVLVAAFAASLSLGFSSCFKQLKIAVRAVLPLPSKGLEYELNEDGASYTVKSIGSCEDIQIVVPETHKDLPVTAIGENAFMDEKIVKAVIPDSVTTIGDSAFRYCEYLVSVELSNSVTEICQNAFAKTSLLSIDIPNSVTTIESAAFKYCAFLTKVHIPENVTSIGLQAFSSCERLKKITVDGDNTAYQSIDGSLYTKDGTTLLQYAIGKEEGNYKTPEGLLTIQDGAFSGGEQATVVEIGDSVTTIEQGAFSGCIGLVEVKIGRGITTIFKSMFSGCSNLTNVVLSDSVTKIEEFAFSSCSFLREIFISRSVVEIQDSAFVRCVRLEKFTVDENNAAYEAIEGHLCEKESKTLVAYAQRQVESVVEIPSGIYAIGAWAIAFCDGLESLILPDSVEEIGEYSFYQCGDLRCVDMGDGVTTIGGGAFQCCYRLRSVSWGEHLTTIGWLAFDNCDLTEVVLPSGTVTIEKEAFYSCYDLKKIVIPESVAFIGDNAFGNCKNLTIYCEVEKKPKAWAYHWNVSKCPIVWGYTGE